MRALLCVRFREANELIRKGVKDKSERADELFRPTEYTGLLLSALRNFHGTVVGQSICDIGTGSGVVAALAAEMGAGLVTATDVEPDALITAKRRILATGLPETRLNLSIGSVWSAIGGPQRFDIVLANLPQFPTSDFSVDGRLPTWGEGGVDGRWVLDEFLDGLPHRLAAGGTALFTQNAFIGIDRTKQRLADVGIDCRNVIKTMIPLSNEKIAVLSTDIPAPEFIVNYSGHIFCEVCVLAATPISAEA